MSSLNKGKLWHKLYNESGQPVEVRRLRSHTSGHSGCGGRLEKSLSNLRTPKQRHCKILYYKAKETVNPPGAAVCISTGLSLPVEGHGHTPKPERHWISTACMWPKASLPRSPGTCCLIIWERLF